MDGIPYGYCHCGCGKQTSVMTAKGHVSKDKLGKPKKYCTGHRGVKPLETRFWEKIKKSDGCWEWQGVVNEKGYGVINKGRVGEGNVLAHRLSWELHNGVIPEGEGYHGICVLHKCDNPSCVNPDHLFLGTNQDNINDMVSKQRNRRGENQPMSKLTDAEVKEIRKLRNTETITYDELGKKYGICGSTVYNIVNRYTWRHIE